MLPFILHIVFQRMEKGKQFSACLHKDLVRDGSQIVDPPSLLHIYQLNVDIH